MAPPLPQPPTGVDVITVSFPDGSQMRFYGRVIDRRFYLDNNGELIPTELYLDTVNVGVVLVPEGMQEGESLISRVTITPTGVLDTSGFNPMVE